MNRLELLIQLSDDVAALCRPYSSAGTRHHGLLQQLRFEMHYSTPAGEGGNGPTKAVDSKPPMPEHVFELLVEIEAEVLALAAAWSVPARNTTEHTLQAVMAKSATVEDEDLESIATSVSYLRRRVEVALGWQERRHRFLNADCPVCGQRTLFVDVAANAAACTSCKNQWPTLVALAELLEGLNA